MMDSGSVVTHAVKGIVDKLADEMEVSLPRMYEILGKDCPVPKAKRLIRAIAKHSQPGARLIRADFNAMWEEILVPKDEAVTAVDLHREAFEAVQACLEDKSPANQARELQELISVASQMLEGIEKQKLTAVR